MGSKIKKKLSIADKYKRLKAVFMATAACFILIIGVFIYYFYLNYDYFVLKHLISQNYIYTDALDELYEKCLGIDVNGEYYEYFDDMVIAVVTKEIRGINNDRYTYLYTPENYVQYKEYEKAEAEESYIIELTENTVYLSISNFSDYTKNFLYNNIDKINNYDNLIIDIRNNLGGTTNSLNDMAELFLEKGAIISTDEMRIELFSYTTRAKKDASIIMNSIIILQDEYSASSAENFILALKENLDNVTTIGQTTFGKGIGQITIPLKRGYAIKATIFKWLSPQGNWIQNIGIPPDIEYDTTDNAIIDYALAIIEE